MNDRQFLLVGKDNMIVTMFNENVRKIYRRIENRRDLNEEELMIVHLMSKITLVVDMIETHVSNKQDDYTVLFSLLEGILEEAWKHEKIFNHNCMLLNRFENGDDSNTDIELAFKILITEIVQTYRNILERRTMRKAQ